LKAGVLIILVLAASFAGLWAWRIFKISRSASEVNPGQSFRYLGLNNRGCKEFRNYKDDMVLIMIPPGKFSRGNPAKQEGADDEQPMRKIYLGAYFIGKYEVTNKQFAGFVKSSGYKPQGTWKVLYKPEMDDYPVSAVTYEDAQFYCAWAGLRLPTEAEWEKAARGSDDRIYPWGNQWDSRKCNNRNIPMISAMAEMYHGRGSLPVGTFPKGASPYGCMDMAGNVWEWCADWYNNHYYADSPCFNPFGPDGGEERVLRGGSWSYSDPDFFRCSKRHSYVSAGCGGSFGFRCAFSK
jgi:formylglycine-generating enzyme required for sulfatase activity